MRYQQQQEEQKQQQEQEQLQPVAVVAPPSGWSLASRPVFVLTIAHFPTYWVIVFHLSICSLKSAKYIYLMCVSPIPKRRNASSPGPTLLS